MLRPVLADVQPGPDSADAGHAPGSDVGGEQAGRLRGVPVQGRGYGLGYDGCGRAAGRRTRPVSISAEPVNATAGQADTRAPSGP